MTKVAICGRVNVGKSTLFNRLLGKQRVVTNNLPGTTRDRVESECQWRKKSFKLIDTGGLTTKQGTDLEKNIQAQTDTAIKSADIILFVCDVRTGLINQDIALAQRLRKSSKKIILVINKADSLVLRKKAEEFKKLGLGKPEIVSAVTGAGTGDLLDRIVSFIKTEEENISKESIKVGIFGKPNVGKSSLLNAIFGKAIVLVSEQPGTTRDVIDTLISYKDKHITLIDTAGIKRKTKIKRGVEKASIKKSLEMIKFATISLLVLDASQPISKQDKRISQRIIEAKCGTIIVVNKWDLIEKEFGKKEKLGKMEKYIEYLQKYFGKLYFAPVIFVSAKTGQNVKKLLDLILDIEKQKNKVISERELNQFLKFFLRKFPPPLDKQTGRRPIVIKLEQQKEKGYIRFKIHIKGRGFLYPPYLNFFEKKIRERYGFNGVPFVLETLNV